jgi:hypothetical protein
MLNYWTERYNNLPNYIVVGEDLDGINGFFVIHKSNEKEFQSGCYDLDIIQGFSGDQSLMKVLADKMNKEAE